jgi:trehalose-phosphatase
MVTGSPRAAVFDLDGVVTLTGRLHEAAWKEMFDAYLRAREARGGEPFRPFESADYRAHVDGRPRYEGVAAFLGSRGIVLPRGGRSDPPEAETVCGLGNRKQQLFHERLHRHGPEVDADAVRFVRELRATGVRVGMASSSRNAALVLERAGLTDLFDARVDGLLSEELGLRGKPAPDIFLTCLERLGGAEPGAALMVEDAFAGIEAGRAAAFGLVLGVDRGENWLALRQAGADWIVRGFHEMSAKAVRTYFRARDHLRPNALAAWPELSRELSGRRLALFLDYDGTLTPIVDRPDLAILSDEMRAALRRVAAVWPTVIVSGRGREDVSALVAVDSLTYAASHGFDVAGPAGSNLRLEVDPEIVPAMSASAGAVRKRIKDIPGVLVEDKKFSVAVHYRLAAPDRVAEIEQIVDAVLATEPRLEKAHGKMVFELRPAREWDKGRAVLWLMGTLGLDTLDVVPIFIGDDTTDEDAFRALAGHGIGIVVLDLPRPTAARYALQNVEEVRLLLDRLVAVRSA